MSKLEDLQPNAAVRCILPDALVAGVSVQRFRSENLGLEGKTPAGEVANGLHNRHEERRTQIENQRWPWGLPRPRRIPGECVRL